MTIPRILNRDSLAGRLLPVAAYIVFPVRDVLFIEPSYRFVAFQVVEDRFMVANPSEFLSLKPRDPPYPPNNFIAEVLVPEDRIHDEL